MLNTTDNDHSSCGSGGSGRSSIGWKQQLVCVHHPTDATQQPIRGNVLKSKETVCIVITRPLALSLWNALSAAQCEAFFVSFVRY